MFEDYEKFVPQREHSVPMKCYTVPYENVRPSTRVHLERGGRIPPAVDFDVTRGDRPVNLLMSLLQSVILNRLPSILLVRRD